MHFCGSILVKFCSFSTTIQGERRTHPFERRNAILQHSRHLILWPKAIIRRDEDAVRLLSDDSAPLILGVEVTDDPTSAVEVNADGELSVAMGGGRVDADWNAVGYFPFGDNRTIGRAPHGDNNVAHGGILFAEFCWGAAEEGAGAELFFDLRSVRY